MPFFTAVGLGLIPGCVRVTALGHNPNIASQGGAADVWEGGGNYPFLAAASKLEVLSASANDTAAGTGARTVLVSGLDVNYNPVSETVTLAGVTPVATVNSYFRVNTFTTVSSGSGEVNAGDLTLRVVGAGSTQSIARAGYGFGRSAVYTVQSGFTLFVAAMVFSESTTFGTKFGVVQRSNTGNRRIGLEFQILGSAPYRHDALLGLAIAQKTDFILRVTSAGQPNANAEAAMEGLLVDNIYLT
jgi:hypothetical protein